MKLVFQIVPLLVFVLHVNAHGVLTAVTGANGVAGQGFGVIADTPRDGTTRNPFQQDTSIIRDKEIEKGSAGVCGRTLAGGDNDVATQLNAAVSAGLPSASADGTVTMTLHQVNGDGAGPYTCDVSTDATGADFAAMTVTTNVPGKNSRSNAKATDFQLVAQMPAGATCTGGPNADACLVRCRNSAQAGPFGGCVAVTNAGTSNSTAAAAAAGAGAATGVASSDDAATVSAVGSGAVAATGVASVDAASVVATGAAGSGATAAVDSGNVAATGVASVDAAAATAVATGAVGSGATAAVNSGNAPAGAAAGADADADAVGATSTPAGTTSSAKSKFGRDEKAEAEDEDEDGDVSIHDAEIALAADLERRTAERVKRSRIFGRRAL